MGYAILDQRGGDSLTATTLDGYSLLADTTVGTATTTVTFNGLNIGWGDELLLVSTTKNSTSSVSTYSLYVNANTTATNYYRQQLYADVTSVGSFRQNSSVAQETFNNKEAISLIKIKCTNNGYFVFQSDGNQHFGTSTPFINNYFGTSIFTISSITQLTITASITNAIGVGSRFQLYKSGGGASRTWAIT